MRRSIAAWVLSFITVFTLWQYTAVPWWLALVWGLIASVILRILMDAAWGDG